MALSSSGAISFSQLQTEFGGSGAISLSEYYSGGLPNNFTNAGSSATVTVSSVASSSSTYTYQSGKANVTGYVYRDGFGSTAGGTSYIDVPKRTGVDKTGNAGDIPSTGTVSLNHFRGTSAGTDNGFRIFNFYHYRDTGSIYANQIIVHYTGHHGTAVSLGNTNQATGFANQPFASISVPAEGNASAYTLYSRGNNSSNALANGHWASFFVLAHNNDSTYGNYTALSINGSFTNAQMGGWSGSINLTFNF